MPRFPSERIADATGLRLSTLRALSWDIRLFVLRVRNSLVPARRRQLRQLGNLSGIHLHFGSGPRIFQGWLNVDAFPYPGLDAELDLRFPLPLADDSCRFIFSEHVLEHFSGNDGLNICKEFFRLLQPGGVCRIIVPDADKYWQAYQSSDLTWFSMVEAGGETSMECINIMFYGHFHSWMYNFESLSHSLVRVGFPIVRRSTHLGSEYPELRLERDEAFRRESSLYVEAVK